jgi:hypothetical protein
MIMRILSATALALTLGASTTSALADEPAASTVPAKPSCFYIHDIESWKAAPDTKTMYIRVRSNRFYRIGLANRCSMLRGPDSYLVTTSIGSDFVCRPIDWQLKVAQRPMGAMGCIVHDITPMTPAEVAALPKKSHP